MIVKVVIKEILYQNTDAILNGFLMDQLNLNKLSDKLDI